MNKVAPIGSQDDLAVRLRALRKVYKLYRNPAYRLRDILGLLPADKRYYDEHVALHDVTLDIRRGEKVAIIGRNGAGKSTLLRLITKVVEPSSGTIEVAGETQALLSLGTGFHPEFTGRQNVEAYLANFGIVGSEAQRMIHEIIDFAELEEYIDQPTKTYSTGMNVRLMFAASTMFVPNLLVIDEVLGVGDAYFQGKSFERIREICSAGGTTLLLVTHDIYTASTLCERMIWIDRGAVLLDAESPVVLKAYDASIRQQEEARLRKKALLSLEKIAKDDAKLMPVLIELRGPNNTPAAAPIQVGRIALLDQGVEIAAAALVHEEVDSVIRGDLVKEGSVWGNATVWMGRAARQMNNFGSSLHKVGASFLIPATIAARLDTLTLEVEAGANDSYELEVWRVDADLRTRLLGVMAGPAREWSAFRTSMSSGRGEAPTASKITARVHDTHGSGRMTIQGIELIDGEGRSSLLLVHGQPVRVLLSYRINDPSLAERCQVVLAWRRNGVDDVFRLLCTDVLFDASVGRSGRLVCSLKRLPLAAGEYSLTVLVAAEGYYESNPTQFFSINSNVYWAKANMVDIKISAPSSIASGTAVVGEAEWSLAPAALATET
jgi:lipopolysaccharide transport system ATP-binding protein